MLNPKVDVVVEAGVPNAGAVPAGFPNNELLPVPVEPNTPVLGVLPNPRDKDAFKR